MVIIESGFKLDFRCHHQWHFLTGSVCQSEVSGQKALPEDLLEKQIFGLHPRPVSKSGGHPPICVLISPPGDWFS